MSSRSAIAWALLAAFSGLPVGVAVAAAPSGQSGSAGGAQVADLKKQLEAGLKARRPQEFAFIARVMALVDAKELPRELVQSTFDWARKKQPHPFQYFERALRIRAAKIGVDIPPA